MKELTEELRLLRKSDPDVALLLDMYEEVERVYRDIMEAMGVTNRYISEVGNSADVTISFRPTPSLSGE